jgi:hypothetical protein
MVLLANLEAKLFGLLSKGVKNAPFFDQAGMETRPTELG